MTENHTTGEIELDNPFEEELPVDAPPVLDAAALRAVLTSRTAMPTEDVPIKRNGKVIATVTLRGLTRTEAMECSKGDPDSSVGEQRMLSKALVMPRMTEDEVKAWQKVSPAHEMAPLVEKINELSGMEPEALKKAMKDFRGS